MTDKEFLSWLTDRLVNVYGESENVDFVTKLRAIAHALPDAQATPNVSVKYGCYMDLSPGEAPDGCVWDYDGPDDCRLATQYKRKEDCPWWRPI